MTWGNTNIKREQVKFIGDWLKETYSFSDLCAKYGISRKTGYKLVNKFEKEGERAFESKSHARHTHPNKTSEETMARILALKCRYPKWGPQTLRTWMLRNEPSLPCPATSTIGEFLRKMQLVKPKRSRRHVPPHSEPLAGCNEPNQIWSADFKGKFRMGDGHYCNPLTVSDNFSRYLLDCTGLERATLDETKKCFIRVFREYGLPNAIRTDNGPPFAGTGIGGLSQLSIWWLKLEILPERIALGCPQQNGRHERMHRTLKEATAKPASKNLAEQQKSFRKFMEEYNHQRPHQALGGQCPADVYSASHRGYPEKLSEIIYPHDMEIRMVKHNGEIKWAGKRFFLSQLLTGEPVGLESIADGVVIIYFGRLKLGKIDARDDRITRIDQEKSWTVLPIIPV
jgi:putative transposase